MPMLHFKGKPLVQNHHLVVPFSELEAGAKEIWETYLQLRAKHGANDELIEQVLRDW